MDKTLDENGMPDESEVRFAYSTTSRVVILFVPRRRKWCG
jgi:hypothetical protein